jgi:hypothetical protein
MRRLRFGLYDNGIFDFDNIMFLDLNAQHNTFSSIPFFEPIYQRLECWCEELFTLLQSTNTVNE